MSLLNRIHQNYIVPLPEFAFNDTDNFCFVIFASQTPCKKYDYTETTILWEIQDTWRGLGELDLMWQKKKFKTTETLDIGEQTPTWK